MRHVKSSTPKSRHYQVLPNGVIRVARRFPNALAEYKKEEIPDYLGAVDHTLKIENKKEYKKAIAKQERRFNKNVREMEGLKLSLMSWLMGRDGAGKTGTVKVIDEALGHDYKLFQSVPFGPPSDEELKHHWLWKYQKYNFLPAVGQVRVFDRCPQERVMVERVMGFSPKSAIQRAYSQLRAYEWLLVSEGGVFVKVWLDITKGEQKARFEAREKDKPWKKSASDEVARARWDDYTPAANELIHRTASELAPQYIVSSEDKKYSRVSILEILNHELEIRIKAAKRAQKAAEKKAAKKDKK